MSWICEGVQDMSKLVRLSLSLEDTLLDKLSALVRDGGYENR